MLKVKRWRNISSANTTQDKSGMAACVPELSGTRNTVTLCSTQVAYFSVSLQNELMSIYAYITFLFLQGSVLYLLFCTFFSRCIYRYSISLHIYLSHSFNFHIVEKKTLLRSSTRMPPSQFLANKARQVTFWL